MALMVACAHCGNGDSYNSYNAPILPPKDIPQPNAYGAPKESPSNAYGGQKPLPVPIPHDIVVPQQNSYGGQPPKDIPQPNSYGGQPIMKTVSKDIPQPNAYGGQPPKDIPQPNAYGGQPPKDIPQPNAYGGQPPRDIPQQNPYGSLVPKDAPQNSYGGAPKPMAPPTNNYGGDNIRMGVSSDVVPIGPDSGVCQTNDQWLGVVHCFHCEFHRCAKQCISEMPKGFEQCYNKTALFNLRMLFEECLGADKSKCHRLTEDMTLAFVLSHYDRRVLDINRRQECLFRCGHPHAMSCMNLCDPLNPTDDVEREPLVVCYKSLEGKVHDMLTEFHSCLDQFKLTK